MKIVKHNIKAPGLQIVETKFVLKELDRMHKTINMDKDDQRSGNQNGNKETKINPLKNRCLLE